MHEFVVMQVCGPEFVALGVASEGRLVLLELGQLYVLEPIFIVEREGFQKEP